MPNHHCCVPGCTSDQRKVKNPVKYPSFSDITFWRFPSASHDPRARQHWADLSGRRNDSVTIHTRICSRHFPDGKPTDNNPHPTVYDWDPRSRRKGRATAKTGKRAKPWTPVFTTKLKVPAKKPRLSTVDPFNPPAGTGGVLRIPHAAIKKETEDPIPVHLSTSSQVQRWEQFTAKSVNEQEAEYSSCSDCIKGFDHVSELEEHILLCHWKPSQEPEDVKPLCEDIKPLCCHECGLAFLDYGTFAKHLQGHDLQAQGLKSHEPKKLSASSITSKAKRHGQGPKKAKHQKLAQRHSPPPKLKTPVKKTPVQPAKKPAVTRVIKVVKIVKKSKPKLNAINQNKSNVLHRTPTEFAQGSDGVHRRNEPQNNKPFSSLPSPNAESPGISQFYKTPVLPLKGTTAAVTQCEKQTLENNLSALQVVNTKGAESSKNVKVETTHTAAQVPPTPVVEQIKVCKFPEKTKIDKQTVKPGAAGKLYRVVMVKSDPDVTNVKYRELAEAAGNDKNVLAKKGLSSSVGLSPTMKKSIILAKNGTISAAGKKPLPLKNLPNLQKLTKGGSSLVVGQKRVNTKEVSNSDSPQMFECPQCRIYEFLTLKELRFHVRSHQFLLCLKCGKYCGSVAQLIEHLHIHVQKDNNPCHQCGLGLSSQKELKKHSILHLPTFSITCNSLECDTYTFFDFMKVVSCEDYRQLNLTAISEDDTNTTFETKSATEKQSQQRNPGKSMNIAGEQPQNPSSSSVEQTDLVTAKELGQVHLEQGSGERFKQSSPAKDLLNPEPQDHQPSSSLRKVVSLCLTCRTVCIGRDAYVKHVAMEHGDTMLPVPTPDALIRCNMCSAPFRTNPTLQRHAERAHGQTQNPNENMSYPCSYCTKEFCTADELRQHAKSHRSDLIKCKICRDTYVFSSQSELDTHIMLAHLNEPPKKLVVRKKKGILCDVCGHVAVCRSALINHQAKHSEERKFACSICKKTFKTKPQYKLHALRAHSAPSFQCYQCPKVFRQPGDLKTHLRFHDDDRPYPCQGCDKAFHTAQNMRVHYAKYCKGKAAKSNTAGK